MNNEDYLKQAYEIQIKAIEDKYQAIIESKNEIINEIIKSKNEIIETKNALIAELRAEIDRLYNMAQLQANQLKSISIQISNQSQTVDMSIINQTHSGSGDNVAGDKNTTYNYNHQDLVDAAKEIQALLEQLSQINPINSTSEQMRIASQAIETIENNPTLKQKAIAAFKQGLLEAIKTNPMGAFVIGAIAGWSN